MRLTQKEDSGSEGTAMDGGLFLSIGSQTVDTNDPIKPESSIASYTGRSNISRGGWTQTPELKDVQQRFAKLHESDKENEAYQDDPEEDDSYTSQQDSFQQFVDMIQQTGGTHSDAEQGRKKGAEDEDATNEAESDLNPRPLDMKKEK